MTGVNLRPQSGTGNSVIPSKGPSGSRRGDRNRDGTEQRDNKDQCRQCNCTSRIAKNAEKHVWDGLSEGCGQDILQRWESCTDGNNLRQALVMGNI